MISMFQRTRFLTAIIVATTLAGCGGEQTSEDTSVDQDTTAAPDPAVLTETRGFFNPKENEEWIYRVTKEVPVSAPLSDHDALRVVEKHENHYELVFERKRVCGGAVEVENYDSELVIIDIFEDGILAEQEYYEINDEGLFGRGWSGTPGTAPVISDSAIPIAVPGMEGGMMWRTSSEENARQYKFRVIGRTTLDLPAGTFDVAQIQITAGDPMSSLKRTLWFAENVGIVKEITTYFDATSIRVRESSELVKWNLPNALQAGQEEEDPFAAEAATTGPSPDEEESEDF